MVNNHITASPSKKDTVHNNSSIEVKRMEANVTRREKKKT